MQIARMSREYRGEIVAVGATPMADLAASVAKLVHDDDIVILGGGSWACFDSVAEPLSGGEAAGRRTARGQYDWSLVFDLIRADKFRIFVGPVQIDRTGAANISVVGDWQQPKVQLIGSRGLPDDLWSVSELHFHLPNQTKRTLVGAVDFISSFGNGPVRQESGCMTGRPGILVTDLAAFHWPGGGDIAVQSIHPGVSPDQVRVATGFDIDIPSDVPPTEPPTPDELRAIRHLTDGS
jgi:glutaconate CoA-transferase subunit B